MKNDFSFASIEMTYTRAVDMSKTKENLDSFCCIFILTNWYDSFVLRHNYNDKHCPVANKCSHLK
jgi:hypothetical protein